ncbi:MAG: ATP-dependent DNA helicase [Armatimonadota bacterium]
MFPYNAIVMHQSIRKLLGPNGRFARLCQGYEHREEQVQMAEAVSDALLHKEHLLVEAGTGVGKSVAYLVPAILHAVSSAPVVVSTHTINLQSQLVNKDIPLMTNVLKSHPFKCALMKGRGNFVCLQELDHAQAALPYEDSNLNRLLKWAAETDTGDIAELDFNYPEWSEVCCNGDTCKGKDCPYYDEQCFYYKHKREGAVADIVIVNHALFFADLSVRMVNPREAILPDYGAIIFDEAHHLEDVATSSFGVELANYRVPMLLNRIKKRRDIAISAGELQFIDTVNNSLFEAFNRYPKSEYFFDEMYESEGKGRVEEIATELITVLDGLSTQLLEQDTDGRPEFKDRLDGYRNIIARIRGELSELFFTQEQGYFRWAEKQSSGKFNGCCLHLTPVNISELFRESLWDSVDSIICTSATLSNSGTFCYIKSRLGAGLEGRCEDESGSSPSHTINELIVGSPFDFMSQSMLYVPADLDPPSGSDEYADTLAARMREILMATSGRAFMLFTSYRMMHAVLERIIDEVPYRLLVQGDMSNERLINEFREDPEACLMGVHSFWEGVDVRGERLSCVIIDKLPFAVPDTPINKARCESIEAEGGNWFTEYAIPQAQIRLKQGFGRLIRTKSDYGIVAILDSRIHTKRYGKDFLRYLPHCKGTKSVSKIRDFLATFEPYDGLDFSIPEQPKS